MNAWYMHILRQVRVNRFAGMWCDCGLSQRISQPTVQFCDASSGRQLLMSKLEHPTSEGLKAAALMGILLEVAQSSNAFLMAFNDAAPGDDDGDGDDCCLCGCGG